jgi:hypothetical protein
LTVAPLAAADIAAIDHVWQCVLATGRLPAASLLVRERLVRQVARIELPSGPAFAKAMSFPRTKDKLRYALRALPSTREAAMLALVRGLGLPCPDVLGVHAARRGLLPFRSLLVLRALDVGVERGDAVQRLCARAAIAARLADHGLLHTDLNPDNFVPLVDGRLAVIDVQSMQRSRDRRQAKAEMAARLLAEAGDLPPLVAREVLAAAGLVAINDERVLAMATDLMAAWLRTRARRCLQGSTEFEVHRIGLVGVEHRHRGDLPPGRWIDAGRDGLVVWLGQRALEIVERSAPVFVALRRSRLPLGRGCSLFVRSSLEGSAVAAARTAASTAFARHRWLFARGARPALVELQRLRQLQTEPLR